MQRFSIDDRVLELLRIWQIEREIVMFLNPASDITRRPKTGREVSPRARVIPTPIHGT